MDVSVRTQQLYIFAIDTDRYYISIHRYISPASYQRYLIFAYSQFLN